ncbi:replication initiation protein RepC [Notoacmeibacter ruber]|uniref:Uncharacterized protein n=1 Tax=Notoacmeibacter ruber TaxID=2670375 RepID=A0A3L7J2Y5_9HYPH|nr:replication initiation protein RepC [Notoacmeibacter ruber]RLQ84988.1 hypothetical protein D8780_15500 [Notoacmeibacter ruber]
MDAESYPALPQGWHRSQIETLLNEIAPAIGLGCNRLAALLYMISRTRPSDWTSRTSEPVYYASQADTALALNKTTRALRYDERVLSEDLGIIELRIKANGSRGSLSRCGIVFSRLIEMVPDLIELRDQLRQEREDIRRLVAERSVYLRRMNKALARLSANHPDRAALAEALNGWPPSRSLRQLPIASLEAHVAAARALCIKADQIVQMTCDSSGRAEQNFRSYIQENKEDQTSECTVPVNKRTSGKPSDFDLIETAPDGAVMGSGIKEAAERTASKGPLKVLLEPDYLYRLAGPDLKQFIAARCSDHGQIRPLDVIDGAHDLLPSLGINYSAWTEAATVMGDAGAALCVLVLDANRDHPMTPVINPGGAFRAMTRKFRAGKLNLTGSLIGLARRRGLRRE